MRGFSLEVPAEEIRWIYPKLLPDEWPEPTALPLTQTIFSEWLYQPLDLGLGVPSAVVDISYNILLHPRHALYQAIEGTGQQDLILAQRLWNSHR